MGRPRESGRKRQPCTAADQPLHNSRPAAWLLGCLAGRLDLPSHEAVRATWSAQHGDHFERWWREALQAGVIPESRPAPRIAGTPSLPALPPGGDEPGLVLAFRPGGTVYDGRVANNAWLQECQQPITTQVWGNAALFSPEDAAAAGIEDGDQVTLMLGEARLDIPALRQPGQARGVVTVSLGYGRTHAGAIGNGIGSDAYRLRPPGQPWYAAGLRVERTGRSGGVLLLQPDREIEGDADEILPRLTLAELRAGIHLPPHHPSPASLYPRVLPGDTSAWAMVIDTTLCIGCNACVIACQAENNVPVVGPEEVAQARNMHWLRVDTYRTGPANAPRPAFAPVPCMHCEKAPCEPVCPVAASVHDSEGLNLQVYNRCIGTRFCQANCPYKVRRFNFHGYAEGQEYADLGSDLIAAQRNPEVSVRALGVMEKCTYCVQRISAARRNAEKEKREIADGEVETACQRACPTRAIVFGDLRKTNSAASALRREDQHYEMLGHLGTRPRTTYLADIRNPSPDLERSQ